MFSKLIDWLTFPRPARQLLAWVTSLTPVDYKFLALWFEAQLRAARTLATELEDPRLDLCGKITTPATCEEFRHRLEDLIPACGATWPPAAPEGRAYFILFLEHAIHAAFAPPYRGHVPLATTRALLQAYRQATPSAQKMARDITVGIGTPAWPSGQTCLEQGLMLMLRNATQSDAVTELISALAPQWPGDLSDLASLAPTLV